jgi:hypothetical protein
MSSLITIKENKLYYNLKNTIEDVSTQVKIISVIGKARTGKSTLMNLLISKWSNFNTTIFKMSDSGDHCTNGVDYYYIKHLNIILLDFQGIYLGDSSQDSKLLLLAYLLSDVIIFNENKMLSNNTLSQFEPMLSFIQYMNKDDTKKCNPKLIFRITDVNLKIDPTTNMHQMLSHQDDQFQSIRDCIHELFDEPFAINTNNLDRSEFKLLKNEDFLGILSETENGFNNAIVKISDYIGCCSTQRSYGSFIGDIRRIVQSINKEERIDFSKLDVVLNLANYEILDYISNIDNSLYSDIIVDGTQELYENNLLSRIKTYDENIKDIYKKFIKLPKNIIDAQLNKFTDKVNPLIEKATKDNLEMANTKLSEIINSKFGNIDRVYKISYTFGDKDKFNKINDNYIKFINDLKNIFANISLEAKVLFKDVFDSYVKQRDGVFKTIETEFNKVSSMISSSIDKCKSDMDKFIEDTIVNINNEILDKFDIQTHDAIEVYYNGVIKEICKDICEKNISEIYENYYIVFNVFLNIDNLTVTTNLVKSKDKASSYFIDINEEYINMFKEQIKTKEKDIYKMLTDKREIMLFVEKGNIQNNKIIENNPDIVFVNFLLHNKNYMMTHKYFEHSLKKDLTQINKICNEEGYQNDWVKFLKEITNIKIVEKTKVHVIDFNDYKQKCSGNYRKLVMLELFELEFKKYFARNKFIFEF